jgi:hypothetical protein
VREEPEHKGVCTCLKVGRIQAGGGVGRGGKRGRKVRAVTHSGRVALLDFIRSQGLGNKLR